MQIDRAGRQDVSQLARLLWVHAAPDEQARQSVESFATDLDAWWADHEASHLAFLARTGDDVVGMAWLALLPRVSRPGTRARSSADLQSVFVLPAHRGRGVGSALVKAATEYALRRGAARVTVQSGDKAVRLYERLGFASSPLLLQTMADQPPQPAAISTGVDAPWDQDLRLVVERERTLLQAELRRKAGRVLSLLHPDFVEHGASGRVWDRRSIAAAVSGTSADVEMSDVAVRRTGPDAVLVTYRSDAGGRRALRSSTWVRDSGEWLLLFHQGTLTADA